MKIPKDMLGREAQVGDKIVYNPPRYKGLTGPKKIIEFTKAACPVVEDYRYAGYDGSVKTDYVIVELENGKRL